MTEKENKTDELLNQVLAELKELNERNKKADEEAGFCYLFDCSVNKKVMYNVGTNLLA